MELGFFKFTAIVTLFGLVTYSAPISFEFFRSLIILSAAMIYHFSEKYARRKKESGMATWRERVNQLGEYLFVPVLIMGVLGLIGLVEVDLKSEPHLLQIEILNSGIEMDAEQMLIVLTIYPVVIFLLDIIFNGSVEKITRVWDKK